MKGKKHSVETRRKMSEAQKGNQNMLGKTLSAEHRRKIGEANKGRKHTAESRRNMSVAAKKRVQRKRLLASSKKIWEEGDYATQG